MCVSTCSGGEFSCMTTQHENSPCCGQRGISWGARRRRCIHCKKTWRAWKRRRGRSRRRCSNDVISAYLQGQWSSLSHEAKRRQLTPATFRARMRRSLDRYITQTPWPSVPDGPLIVIADAQAIRIKWSSWTVFYILVRSVQGTEAVILPPYVRAGTETTSGGWEAAFAQVPETVKNRIHALVCDGRRVFKSITQVHGWYIQRCHFHLLAAIQGRRSKGGAGRHEREGKLLYALATTALITCTEEELHCALKKLTQLQYITTSNQLRLIIAGFIRHYGEYRTYLEYPELHLPRTSNTAECLIGLIRKMQRRAHGFGSIESLEKWIIAFCKDRKTIACKGHDYQPN